jgi:hypothetical protein
MITGIGTPSSQSRTPRPMSASMISYAWRTRKVMIGSSTRSRKPLTNVRGGVGHRRPRLCGRFRLALLQQLDRMQIGRAHKRHRSVALRPVELMRQCSCLNSTQGRRRARSNQISLEVADDRIGSKADLAALNCDFRSSPASRHRPATPACSKVPGTDNLKISAACPLCLRRIGHLLYQAMGHGGSILRNQ